MPLSGSKSIVVIESPLNSSFYCCSKLKFNAGTEEL